VRLAVDTDFCQGHAVCVSEAPNVFSIGDDGKVRLLAEFPADADRAAVELAEKHCPTGSIRITRGA
jgi:sterol 14-demethylase